MVFSGKNKKEQNERILAGILDSLDCDAIVVRGPKCEVLYKNASARERQLYGQPEGHACLAGYSCSCADVCAVCPCRREGLSPDQPLRMDVVDEYGNIFALTASMLEWWDEKPAYIFLLWDVTEERTSRKKLYEMAYLDQLTQVPNRQKFKEDFEAVREQIENNQLRGLVGIFDLDNFKQVNDTYGHNTGDVMLRRLTEYLVNHADFGGHLYRLGGDEFVLFYADAVKDFPSDEAYHRYCREKLQGAFLSYTMPNIDLACTISLGAAFFPQHGDTTSELLRKADIALYTAKESGRNQLVFFEDKYDMAQKFKDVFVNIQPLLLASERTFGYELVDRGGEDSEEGENINLTEINRTLDTLGLNEIENDAHYFISYSKQLHNPAVLNNLPKDKFIIQVAVADIRTEGELKRYRSLCEHGFKIALTGLTERNATPAMLAIANYCRFAPGFVNQAQQKKIIATNPGKHFIATQVDTAADFEQAKKLGYSLFQGYFFKQPVVVQKTKDIEPLKFNYYRLLQLTCTDDYVDFKEISSVIASDLALSYKLLRLLNSAAVGLRSNISSISMAVAYLGEDNLKKWISLLALRGVANDKPLELVRMSLIRARFGELLTGHFRLRRDPKQVFLVGMLSLLHIALEKSKEELFAEIPVAEDIRNSLLTKHGVYSDLLSFFNSYEYANWEEVTRFANENNLEQETINDCYLAAVKWCNNLVNA